MFDLFNVFGNAAAKADEERSKELLDSHMKVARTEKCISQLDKHLAKLKECMNTQSEVLEREGESELYRALLREAELRQEIIGLYASMLGIEHGTW